MGFQTIPLRYLKEKNLIRWGTLGQNKQCLLRFLDVKKNNNKKKTEQNKQTKKPLAQIFEGGGGREDETCTYCIFLLERIYLQIKANLVLNIIQWFPKSWISWLGSASLATNELKTKLCLLSILLPNLVPNLEFQLFYPTILKYFVIHRRLKNLAKLHFCGSASHTPAQLP